MGRTVAIVLVCALALALGLAGHPVSAGDGSVTISVEPETVEATPGETVTLEVYLNSHGDLHGNGVGDIDLDISYAAPLELESVDHDPWLAEAEGELTTDVAVDRTNRTVSVNETLDTAGDGVRGGDTILTLSLTVPDDAEPANAAVEVDEATVVLVTDWPQGVIQSSATVLVDGGIEESAENHTPDGVTLGEDADLSETADDTDDEPDDEDSIPGPGVVALAVALLLAVWYRSR